MTTIAFELDSPYFAVQALREFAENDANWTAMATTLANAIDADAGQRVIVLDVDEAFPGDDTLSVARSLRNGADQSRYVGYPTLARVGEIVAEQLEPRPDPRVQRVLDVAAETDVDITIEQAKRIADALLPEKTAPQMSDAYLDALSKEPRGFA